MLNFPEDWPSETAAFFSTPEREVLYRAIHARRDIRHFQAQPIPPEILVRLLEAAHAAPSVGFLQPWNFMVIESPEIRQKVKTSFEATNAQEKVKAAETGREDLYGSLRLEGILESPLNLAITCDPGRHEKFVLGRDPMPQTAAYSVCLAIQNLWLAARVEGIGVGWVSLLDKTEIEQILGLPPGVELVAYLCLGYPVAFRTKPMLEELGWKKRTALAGLVFQDQWGEVKKIGLPSLPALVEKKKKATLNATLFSEQVKQKMDRKTKPPGSLGRLENLAIRLAEIQCTLSPRLDRKRLCVYAGSHGITQEGISAYPSAVTAQMVLNFIQGGAAINVLARQAEIEVQVIDAGVDGVWPEDMAKEPRFYARKIRAGTRNFRHEPAMTQEECEAALEIGREQVRLAKADGVDVLGIGEMGIGNTTSASALIVALLGFPAEEAVGRGTGISDDLLRHKVDVVTAVGQHHANEETSPRGLYWLRCVGGYEIAAMTGTILEASRQGLPLVVDGFIATASAVVAFELCPEAREVCFFSHRSEEKAHGRTLAALKVEPILDLGLRLGEGTGCALAIPILEAAAKILCEMATFQSAGISESITQGTS